MCLKKWYNRPSKKLQGSYKEITKTRLSKQKTEKGIDISHQTKIKSKQNTRTKIVNVCAGLDEIDDSGDDKTYSPRKCSNSSAESEDNTEISELIYKKEPVRNKAWKRRENTILSPQKFHRKKQGTRIFITPIKTKSTLRCPKSPSSAVEAMQIQCTVKISHC